MFSWRQDPTVVLFATLSCILVLQSLPLPQVLEPSFLWYTCSQFMLLKLFELVLDFKFIYILLQNGLIFTSCKHKYQRSSPGWSPCCPYTHEDYQPYLLADFQSSAECQQMCTSLHWNLVFMDKMCSLRISYLSILPVSLLSLTLSRCLQLNCWLFLTASLLFSMQGW